MNIPAKYDFRVYFLENQTPISPAVATGITSSTYIEIANHGLETDDFIINQTRRSTSLLGAERGSRRVTKVSDDVLLVNSISGQSPGDNIILGKFIDRTSLVKQETLKMNFKMDNDSTCEFDMILEFDPITRYDYTFYKDQYVRIKLGNDWIFTGVIKGSEIELVDEKLNFAIFKIKLQSLKTVLKYRTIRIDYSIGDNTNDIIDDMMAFLVQEGLVSGTIGTGIDIEEDWKNDCISISDVIEKCNNKNSYQFVINHDFTCDWFDDPSTIENAPFDIDDYGTFTDYSKVKVSDQGEYLNKAFLVGGMGSNGNQVFAIKGDLTEQNNYQKRSFGTGVKGKVIRDSSNVELTEYTALTGTTTTNITINSHPFSVGDYIYNWDRETSTFVTSVIDSNNVTVISVAGQTADDLIIYYPSAQAYIDNEMRKYKNGYKTITFKTNTWGFLPRQKLKVYLQKFLINSFEYYSIESVTFSNDGAKNYTGVVSASLRDNSDFTTQQTGNFSKKFFTSF